MRWIVLVVVILAPAIGRAQDLQIDQPEKPSKTATTTAETPDAATQFAELRNAAIRLPLAAGLASLLALRPRRRGTPFRQTPVIQTQIILAIVGAVVMMVVGSSLARAFGIVGAAGLVRYRAKIEDPKDAGVMLSTLAVGLASGVGLWMIATFGTAFILLVLWIVESFEPKAKQSFTLKVKASDPAGLQPKLERVLNSHHVKFELRGTSKEELHYEIQIPIDRKADRITDTILAIDPKNATAAELEEKKEKK
ncbi:MAG TPA: DUF4956 domain-containing protein [Vicinamibacterales bacterium]|nr:DUF4956 domain-containing protein [Vicinamibacterales bacterium]